MGKIVIEVPDNCKGCRFIGGNDDNWGKCEIFYGEVLISKDYYKRCPECLAAELTEPKEDDIEDDILDDPELPKTFDDGKCLEGIVNKMREPKEEVKECEWTIAEEYMSMYSTVISYNTKCGIKNALKAGKYCQHCGNEIKETK